jgi:hypothetical protein
MTTKQTSISLVVELARQRVAFTRKKLVLAKEFREASQLF